MSRFIVEGGIPLKGAVRVSGAKNAAVKMVAASLLTDEPILLEDVPEIADVEVDLEIVRSLGVSARKVSSHVLELSSEKIHSFEVFPELASRSRAAVLVLGPLLSRFGKAKIYQLGGCAIGARPIDRHLKALEALGAKITCDSGAYVAEAPLGLKAGTIKFEKQTVMGTENAILASVLVSGETSIVNAAKEPEVDDLIDLLKKMGAQIERIEDEGGVSVLKISGVRSLFGAKHKIIPDRNEAVTLAVAAAVTRGDLAIENVRPKDLLSFLAKLSAVGVKYEVGSDFLRVWADAGDKFSPCDIQTLPHPGFMTDWQQPFSVLLTQAEGQSIIHETVYSNRFDYVKELNRMEARIDLFHPNLGPRDYSFDGYREDGLYSAKVFGPTRLKGERVKVSDLRAGATLVLAALCAEGKSEILGVELIDRGYEHLDEKLRILGAKISRFD